MKIIKKMPRRNIRLAADLRVDLDVLAARLQAAPGTSTWKDDEVNIIHRSRQIFMHLATGRYASLCESSMRGSVVEIELEIQDEQAFFEDDLQEIMHALQIDVEYAKRYRQFSWIPGTQAGNI
jgi:hypothetical protein